MSLLIVSPPRSGSSLLSQLIENSGIFSSWSSSNSIIKSNPSEFNQIGYNEDICFTLLNDQLIKCLYGEMYSFLYSPESTVIKKYFNNYKSMSLEDLIPDKYFYDLNYENIYIKLLYWKLLSCS